MSHFFSNIKLNQSPLEHSEFFHLAIVTPTYIQVKAECSQDNIQTLLNSQIELSQIKNIIHNGLGNRIKAHSQTSGPY